MALLYAFVAGAWIVASDKLLSLLVEDPLWAERLGMAKGGAFVLITALLLYLLLQRWSPAGQGDFAPSQNLLPARRLVTAFAILALLVPLLGYAIQRAQARQVEADAYDMLQAVADLKGRQISRWLDERDGDGQALLLSAEFAEHVRRWLVGAETRSRVAIQDRLDAIHGAIDYDGVVLLDRDGRPLLAAGHRQDVPAAVRALLALPESAAPRIRRTGFYRDEAGGVHLDWLVPIGGDRGRSPMAYVLLHAEPDHELYPLIAGWHTPGSSGESFLVRRDGGDVHFLSPLRHRADAPLSFRLSADTPALASALLLGNARAMSLPGIDYRGVHVLATGRPIESTDWLLVAKIDAEEIRAPLNRLVRWVSVVAVCAIAAVAALLLLYWRQQRHHDGLAREAETAARIRDLNAQLEARVAERTAQLADANRELESFAFAVSHDLKAPLRGIAGYSRLLASEHAIRLDDDGRRFLAHIQAAADHMQQMIDDLLAYARLERGGSNAVLIDLGALVTSVLAEFRAAISDGGVELHLDLPAMPIVADRDGLSVAVRNLVDNAIKFSREADPPRIEIAAWVGAQRTRLRVRDNGIGFDMNQHERIFELFSRLDPASGAPGTGLGLALVRKAMQRMGGRAWGESSGRGGAAFYLEWPQQSLTPTRPTDDGDRHEPA